MLKIFRASRETDYPGQDEYFNGSGMLQRSLLKGGGKCASTTNDLNKGKKKNHLIKCIALCQHDSLLGEVTGILLNQWQEEPNQYISYLPISLKASIPVHAHTLRHMHLIKLRLENLSVRFS